MSTKETVVFGETNVVMTGFSNNPPRQYRKKLIANHEQKSGQCKDAGEMTAVCVVVNELSLWWKI